MNDALLRYVTGNLSPEVEQAFEEELFSFADVDLGASAARLAALVDALRAMAAQGGVVPVVVEAELAVLGQATRLIDAKWKDGALTAHIDDADFVYARVPVAHDAPGRVHVLFCTPQGEPYFRVQEAPFDPTSGEIIVLYKAHVARAAGTLLVRVVDDDDRIVGQASLTNV